jgi:heat shock protein HslJ
VRLQPSRRSALALGLLIVIMAVSCGAPSDTSRPPAASPATLAGTAWRLLLIGGRVPPAGPPVTIAFTATDVSGAGPCNSFSGRYTIDPQTGAIRIGELGSTKRACAEPARSDLENALFTSLTTATAAGVDPDGRLLLTGSGAQLVWLR